MHGLVAHTQQSPVRHAETEAVGGDGGAFHVQRDRPALAETALRRALRQQLPVAVVGAGEVPVRITRLRSWPVSCVTSATAASIATCTSASGGIGTHSGKSSSST